MKATRANETAWGPDRRAGGRPLPTSTGPPTETGGLLTALDHVGIAVADLDEAVNFYETTFGAHLTRRERVEHDGVEEALLAVGDGYVQLLTPTRADSAVAKFLAMRGPGLHHVGYRVADCRRARDLAVAAGAEALDDEPRPGSRGTIVAFLHPKTALGTLIELVEVIAAPPERGGAATREGATP